MKKTVSLFLYVTIIISILSASLLQAFAVISNMTLTGAVYPTYLDEGMSFSISGEISSNSNITSVTVGVYRKSSGEAVIVRTATPNSTTYNISAIDDYISFGSLSEDNYIYKIIASDKNTSNKELISKNFVVGFPNGSVGDKMDTANWKVLDISQWQPTVNWSSVKNEVDAVILRIGYRGTGNLQIYEDTSFSTHYKNAVEQGLPVGVYFYSVALSVDAAIEEAEFIIDTLEKYDCKLSMPVYFDMEFDSQLALGRKTCTELAKAFCERMIEDDYMPGIYCNLNWAKTGLIMSELADYTVWLAQYSSSCLYTGKYEMWQYTETGSVSGISGNVDLSYCYKDIPKYISEQRYNKEPVINYADYTELDKMISMVPNSLAIYTQSSRTTLEAVLTEANSLNRKLLISEQAKVDTIVSKLKKAINGLVLAGGFEKNENSEVSFDDVNQIVHGIPEKTTPSDLLNKYITLKGEAYVEYDNFNGYITTDTIIYIKINGVTIAKYRVR